MALIGPALALMIMAAPRPAFADLSVCNENKQTVIAAVGYHDGQIWVSEGWFTIRAGQCAPVYERPLSNRYYYLYARTADRGRYWGGDYYFCIHEPNEFTIYGDEGCDVGFLEIDTLDESVWTHSLVP